jgi:dTDP-4-dehydrorhamnose reductase
MRKVLITGASGMVGYAMCRVAIDQSYIVTGFGRYDRHAIPGMQFESVDLLDLDRLASAFRHHRPDLVIHLAANTNQSECERSPELAKRLHVDASATLAAASFKLGSRFVYISTEAVYGNLGPGKRKETDACKPEGVYARSKKEGEEQVLSHHPEALALRVTPVGYAPNGTGRTFVEWLVHQLGSGQSINGYTDVYFTPVSSYALARLILCPGLDGHSGIYNWGNSESLSKYEFACRLTKSLGYETDSILPGRRFPGGDAFHGGMDSSALSNLLEIPQPSTEELFADLKRNIQHR